MPSIEASLLDRLESSSDITALVSDRIFPLFLTQGATTPAIVYTRINSYGEHANATSATLIVARFRFDCYARTITVAKDLAAKVKASLDGYIGTILSIDIDGILYVDEYDSYDQDTDLPVVGVDFRVWYRI